MIPAPDQSGAGRVRAALELLRAATSVAAQLGDTGLERLAEGAYRGLACGGSTAAAHHALDALDGGFAAHGWTRVVGGWAPTE